MELFLEGYDHILDVVDDDGVPITEVVANRGDTEMSNLLASIPAFEVSKYLRLKWRADSSNMIPKCYKGHKIDVFFHKESRESLHGAIRRGDLASVEATLSAEGGEHSRVGRAHLAGRHYTSQCWHSTRKSWRSWLTSFQNCYALETTWVELMTCRFSTNFFLSLKKRIKGGYLTKRTNLCFIVAVHIAVCTYLL